MAESARGNRRLDPRTSNEGHAMSIRSQSKGLANRNGSRRLLVETLEERSTPAVFTWTGASDHDWFNAGNWSPNWGVPSTNDTAIFNNGAAGFATNSTPVALSTLNVSAGTFTLGAAVTVDTADFSASVNTGIVD